MTNNKVLDYIKKSFELKGQGFYKPAIEMLYKALAIEPENIEILAQLAHLYKLLNNDERAVYYVEKVLDITPEHKDCLSLLQEIYLYQKDLKMAKKITEKICKIAPCAENFSKMIKVLNELNEFEEIKKLQSSMDFKDESVVYEFANAFYKNNEKQTAFELLTKGTSKDTSNENILELLAQLYYEKGEADKSKELFERLIEIAPTSKTLNHLGLFALKEQNFYKAVDYFTNAQKLDDKDAEIIFNLASAQFMLGRLAEAKKHFQKAICFAPENLNYHYSLAYLYYQEQNYEKALKELKLIQSVEPQHHYAKVLDAMITAQTGNLFEAKNQLEEIIGKNDFDDFAYYALSFVCKELDNFEAAEKFLTKAISLKPDSLEYLSELAELEISSQKFDEALKIVEKLIELSPKYIDAYVALAKIKTAEGEFEEVFDAAQEIIELDSNTPQGYYYNALALFSQNDVNFAIESLKKAISLDLTNATLYEKMSEFYKQLGDFAQAYEWGKEAADIDAKNYLYKWNCAKLSAKMHNEENATKWYSQSYRIASFDEKLKNEYASYLSSIGKEKQAQKLLK